MVSEQDDTPGPSEHSEEDSEVAGEGLEPEPDQTDTAESELSPESSPESDVGTEVTDDEQTWGVVLHASAFSGLVVPFGNILAPLLIWLIKKEESEFIDASGKEALNFQLTWTMLMLGALLTLLVGVGFLLVPIIAVAWIVLVVLATVKASDREVYDYPLTVDLID